jgi:hypothetical protein
MTTIARQEHQPFKLQLRLLVILGISCVLFAVVALFSRAYRAGRLGLPTTQDSSVRASSGSASHKQNSPFRGLRP